MPRRLSLPLPALLNLLWTVQIVLMGMRKPAKTKKAKGGISKLKALKLGKAKES